ncbi:hypothetical protein KSF_096660 [Reticulibacter mediterranei]|uniref:Alcohol dehydrogenase n=1 Tax=Reticulibacter mediterranei TaxID=2778369 RepID=A0A8J3ISH0_9CHLR|nr:hydrogenase maturation nickel metallochaperone HypA [Reticulibacter mediterranei]GHO99618.1 hypothetical protein KSF_096660 [Reticulibacter mediterranei]
MEMTGAGNIPPEVVPEAVQQVWEWIKEDTLHIEIEEVPLKDIAKAWQRTLYGKRIVIVP